MPSLLAIWPRQSRPYPSLRFFRLTQVKANVNCHLVQHRRIVLPDTGLLLSPLLKLIVEQEPEYRSLLKSAVVPILRPNAANFREVLTVLRKNGNYRDPENTDLDAAARLFDELRPNVGVSAPGTQDMMDAIGRNVLLYREYWTGVVGLGESSSALVAYVPDAMARNRAVRVRQSEFWEFADILDSRGLNEEAQVIRTELTLISLGCMAANLNLTPALPAFATAAVSRLFGVPVNNEQELRNYEGWTEPDLDLLTGISLLTPSDIHAIRESGEFGAYIDTLEKSDSLGAARIDYERAKYLKWLGTAVQTIVAGRMEKWKKLKHRERVLLWSSASGLSGVAVAVYDALSGAHIGVNPLVAWGIALTLVYLKKRVSEAVNQVEGESCAAFKRHLSVLATRSDIGAFLYGPQRQEFWRSVAGRTRIPTRND